VKISFQIDNLEPCPRNRSHTVVVRGKFAQNIKTEAARSYEQAIRFHLDRIPTVKEFSQKFDKNKHQISATFHHFTPDFYTATGKISENSVDFDAHKVLVDTVCDYIGIDDAYFSDARITKQYLEHFSLIVHLEIKNLR
jgi:hypothetical protein